MSESNILTIFQIINLSLLVVLISLFGFIIYLLRFMFTKFSYEFNDLKYYQHVLKQEEVNDYPNLHQAEEPQLPNDDQSINDSIQSTYNQNSTFKNHQQHYADQNNNTINKETSKTYMIKSQSYIQNEISNDTITRLPRNISKIEIETKEKSMRRSSSWDPKSQNLSIYKEKYDKCEKKIEEYVYPCKSSTAHGITTIDEFYSQNAFKKLNRKNYRYTPKPYNSRDLNKRPLNVTSTPTDSSEYTYPDY